MTNNYEVPSDKRTESESSVENTSIDDSNFNDWTIMIYHSGESGLSEELIWSLKEMVRVGTRPKVDVVALMDSISPTLYHFTITSDAPVPSKGSVQGAQTKPSQEVEKGGLFHSKKIQILPIPTAIENNGEENSKAIGGSLDKSTEDVVHVHRTSIPFSNANLASADFLLNFIVGTINQHPAHHYMLILSGHGAGMIGETLLRDAGADRFLSVPKLQWVLLKTAQEIQKISGGKNQRLNILGFDSCAMLTAEVANLLRNYVEYIVGSEGLMRNSGWPYHLILDYLKNPQDSGAKAMAIEIVKRGVQYYSDFSRVGLSIDMAAIELCGINKETGKSNWQELIENIRQLTLALTNQAKEVISFAEGGEHTVRYLKGRRVLNAVIAAHWYAQSYAEEEYVDLYDFCEQLKIAEPEFSDQCNKITSSLKEVVVKSCRAGGEFQHSHGLSLYFPWDATKAALRRYTHFFPRFRKRKNNPKKVKPIKIEEIPTPFNEATGWGDFLTAFIQATRRRPRKGSGKLIFMPPPGYRDHLRDLKPIKADNRHTTEDNRHTTEDNRHTTEDNRHTTEDNKFGIRLLPYSKVKNPSFEFYENQFEDSDD
jgi:hypothetical protein